MNTNKRKRIEKAGWNVGTAQEFLNLSQQEVAYIELKLRLAQELAKRRRALGISQVQVRESG